MWQTSDFFWYCCFILNTVPEILGVLYIQIKSLVLQNFSQVWVKRFKIHI